ncbi:hypothetical protein [Plantibacter sp. YIM 135347]|uniref:hypothetical protein n=1 Tax=Plantibacter sp. YIM 135347 TaxID=3423919 RepID=UPI003D349671
MQDTPDPARPDPESPSTPGPRPPRERQSWPTRLVLLLSGTLFATVDLTFTDAEHLARLRGVFAANGWTVDPTDAQGAATVVRLHRVFKDSIDAGSPSSIERELRAMVGGVPNSLVACSVTLAVASSPSPPDRLVSALEYDGPRLLRARLTASYPPSVAPDDAPGDARVVDAAALRAHDGAPERPRVVRLKLALCIWATVTFALLPTQVLPHHVVRGIDIVIPVVAVSVVLAALCVWFLAHQVRVRWSSRRRPVAVMVGGPRAADLVEIAAVGAVFGLGVGEVYAYYAENPEGVPHIFLIVVTVLLLILVALAVGAVTIAVRVFRSRTPGFVLGAALMLGMGAAIVRLPSWAYFSGMGVAMFSADLDWPSAVLLAIPFFVASAAAILILALAWAVRRFIRSTGTRLALQAACVAGVVVALVSSLAGSFVDGRDILSTTSTARNWAGFPHPICLSSTVDPSDWDPYWFIASTGGGMVVIRRHVPGVETDPAHVVIEQLPYAMRGIRFVDEVSPCPGG